MTLDEIGKCVSSESLEVFGGFHPVPGDGVPAGIGTMLLLGPREPGFWDHVTGAPEFSDGTPDPLDRWSRRVIGALARDLAATAFFPFSGPPWHPFIGWARRSGRAWPSPVTVLVHDTAGLMVSYRGALGLPDRLDLPGAGQRPCDGCTASPCITACPVSALDGNGYDVAACKAFLRTPEGIDCMTAGCRVRRACPVSENYGRRPEQSGFHMGYFLG